MVDVSDIFYFFCSGRGKGESEAPGGGRGRFFFLKIQEGGSPGGGGAEGPGGSLRRIGELGGGLNIFCRGRNAHQVLQVLESLDNPYPLNWSVRRSGDTLFGLEPIYPPKRERKFKKKIPLS